MAYDVLNGLDSRTNSIPEKLGTSSQWEYALKLMNDSGNWHRLADDQFGSGDNLVNSLSSYINFDVNKRWLYYIGLLMFGTTNPYLRFSLSYTNCTDELVRNLFRSILRIKPDNPEFVQLYSQRKEIVRYFQTNLSEISEFCKVLATKGEESIYYLTDLNQIEKERIISWLDTYGYKYDRLKLITILSNVYPDLAKYLSSYRFNNAFLDSYFNDYKYQKVINRILPSFEEIVNEQAIKLDFVNLLKPRTVVVDKLDVKKSQAFFLDALGVEYLGFIQEKCRSYGLSANIVCARCELPSITSENKEFVLTLKNKGCDVSSIKDLDEIKHHGKDSFDYEKEKTPIYLIEELRIIDELLTKIRSSILTGKYDKAIILSDHGASRLAVLHETENMWHMATTGEHSGRCCRISEIDTKPDFAIEESGFWVLANYDRFKGSRKSNVEVHGGASLEEVAVPIIEITQKQKNIEAFITDESKIVTLAAKEHARIKV